MVVGGGWGLPPVGSGSGFNRRNGGSSGFVLEERKVKRKGEIRHTYFVHEGKIVTSHGSFACVKRHTLTEGAL